METRANYFWVGLVTLMLLGLLAYGIVWVAGLNNGSRSPYDILFKSSVSGLSKGSGVSFAGVPVGQVTEIQLWENDPEYVRVRIEVDDNVPILVGTTATLQSSFTGPSSILLDGARADAPKISCEITDCPDGAPLIPSKASGLGEIVANAPLLLERIATVTERLNMALSDENIEEFSSTLRNANRLTGEIAEAVPAVKNDAQLTTAELRRTLQSAQVTFAEADAALIGFQKVTNSADGLINKDGVATANELRKTLKTANQAIDRLSKTLEKVGPAADRLNAETIPEAEETLADLREATAAVKAITEQLSDRGVGSLINGQALPEYKP